MQIFIPLVELTYSETPLPHLQHLWMFWSYGHITLSL